MKDFFFWVGLCFYVFFIGYYVVKMFVGGGIYRNGLFYEIGNNLFVNRCVVGGWCKNGVVGLSVELVDGKCGWLEVLWIKKSF